jgi:precorrin-6x reductase
MVLDRANRTATAMTNMMHRDTIIGSPPVFGEKIERTLGRIVDCKALVVNGAR